MLQFFGSKLKTCTSFNILSISSTVIKLQTKVSKMAQIFICRATFLWFFHLFIHSFIRSFIRSSTFSQSAMNSFRQWNFCSLPRHKEQQNEEINNSNNIMVHLQHLALLAGVVSNALFYGKKNVFFSFCTLLLLLLLSPAHLFSDYSKLSLFTVH